MLRNDANINFRVPRHRLMVYKKLADKLNKSVSELFRDAVDRLAKKEGITEDAVIGE